MKTIKLPDKLWMKLQKLKLKWRKKSVAEVIQEVLVKSGLNTEDEEQA